VPFTPPSLGQEPPRRSRRDNAGTRRSNLKRSPSGITLAVWDSHARLIVSSRAALSVGMMMLAASTPARRRFPVWVQSHRLQWEHSRQVRSLGRAPPEHGRRPRAVVGPRIGAASRATRLRVQVRRRGRRLEYARHGRSIGGGSPLGEEVVLTPSRRQLCGREAGWEGSPRRNPALRNTNRVEGGAIWVSLLKKVKPVTINRVVS
jgi:hypothetical protein